MQSLSRPSVSNDNANAESLFRTLKYSPRYPKGGRFKSLEDVREWVENFVRWYNHEHRLSGIKYMTPAERHEGRDVEILKNHNELYELDKSEKQGRWTGKTRNWEPEGPEALNPGKTQTPEPAKTGGRIVKI